MAKKKDEEQQVTEYSNDKLTKELIKELNKNSEENIAWSLLDPSNPTVVSEWISTGSTLLDYIISNRRNGGIPVGKLTEINGEEASGKSLVCAHLIAEVQRRGGIAVYLDTESAANPEFMKQIGVDVSKLVYAQPGTVEEVGSTIERIILSIRAKSPDKLVLIIWDSVAGTPCQAEIEGTFDPTGQIGLMARALGKMMRKLGQVWGKERIALVFTNQLKTKIGVTYGDPMTTMGGKAIPYHSSVRVRLTRSVEIKDATEKDESRGQTYAINTKAKVIKNRQGPPLRKCDFKIYFSHGIDDVGSWFEYLHGVGEIEKAGGWCYFTSFPSGKVKNTSNSTEEDQKDRGLQFRESRWNKLIEENQEFKNHVLNVLEKHLIINFGEEPKDRELDPESLMENEEENV